MNVVTVSGPNRWPYLFATMSAVLANARGVTWWVYLHHTEQHPETELIDALAAVTGNEIRWERADVGWGVGQIKAHHLRRSIQQSSWLVNIDDDEIIPAATWQRIEQAAQTDPMDSEAPGLFTYTFFDVLGTRGYVDWDAQRRDPQDLLIFAKEKGIRSIAYHLWYPSNIKVRTDHVAGGSWILNTSRVTDELLAAMDQYGKGIRGYDLLFDLHLRPIVHLVGASAYHMGVMGPILAGEWQQLEEPVQQPLDRIEYPVAVVDLDGLLTNEPDCDPTVYARATPNEAQIAKLRAWRQGGGHVVIHTARWPQDRNLTMRWLAQHNVPFDELVMGKPRGDIYVDDRNVDPSEDWGQK